MNPPGVEVALYEVIAAPPLNAGAVKATRALVELIVVATPIVGAFGSLGLVVTAGEGLEELEVPTELVAVTVKLYAVPGVKPETVMFPEPA